MALGIYGRYKMLSVIGLRLAAHGELTTVGNLTISARTTRAIPWENQIALPLVCRAFRILVRSLGNLYGGQTF